MATAVNCGGCTYKNNVGLVVCDDPKPALNRCGIYICFEDLATYTKTECDPALPASGQVTDITLQPGATGFLFTVREDSEDFNSSESVNDNGNNEIDEIINGQVDLDAATVCWFRENLGKELIHIKEGKDGKLYAFGLDGGMKLNDFSFQSGKTGTDFQGGEYNFINDTSNGFCCIDPVAAGFTDNDDFLTSLL